MRPTFAIIVTVIICISSRSTARIDSRLQAEEFRMQDVFMAMRRSILNLRGSLVPAILASGCALALLIYIQLD